MVAWRAAATLHEARLHDEESALECWLHVLELSSDPLEAAGQVRRLLAAVPGHEKARAALEKLAPPPAPGSSTSDLLSALQAFVTPGADRVQALPELRRIAQQVDAFDSLADGAPLVRLGEGDLVAVHSRYTGVGPGPLVLFEIFRVQDGKLVEHWDGKESEGKPSPSGHTMLDGATEIRDMDRTEANRQVVNDFLKAGPLRGEMVEINELAGFLDDEAYVQHNPRIADGITGLGAFLSGLRARGVGFRYTQVHRMLAEGNFVLAQSEGQIAGTKNAFYDLFRVENGKLAALQLADGDLGVAHAPIAVGDARVGLAGTERLRVELDRPGRSLDIEVRKHVDHGVSFPAAARLRSM